MRTITGAFVVMFASLALGAAPLPGPESVTWTGWFSDAGCAKPRVKQGLISPNNPECVKKCLADGAEAVFISEQAKALFSITGYASVKEDVGWRVELTGVLDETGQRIAVSSVKRLELTQASCALPRKSDRRS